MHTVKIAGVALGIVGALFVAFKGLQMQDYGYACFLVGSAFSLMSAIQDKDYPNSILWAVFFLINCFGLLNYAN